MEPPPLPLATDDSARALEMSVVKSAAAEACDIEIALVESDPAPENPSEALPTAENSAWRDELSARLNRYRARRKAPPPRYPSLRLPFDRSTGESDSSINAVRSDQSLPTFNTISNQALALDGSHNLFVAEPSTHFQPEEWTEDQPPARQEERKEKFLPTAPPPRRAVTAKIIEFPRFSWDPPAPPPDQLAEPVGERPRILEVPETAPPPPALGGITIEPVHRVEAEKRPGIDIPLERAPLALRLFASLIDWLIVAAASALFGFIFWKVAAVRPPRLLILALAAGISGMFWVAYQYLLIVYSATTPGLHVSGLALTRFDGSAPKRSVRRWRVLASCLSAISLGMGYAWVFLDEDALCWHDRITRTYLAPIKSASHASM
ncbi:MAG TPA: RDD family protein [Candidatus Sulfotelmatobacter sp.]|nr:RDD family protein [Candidatus Sulfotelmatobacter sp.]